MKKIIGFSFFILTVICILCLAACGTGGEDDNKTYKVMVSVTEGSLVLGDNPVYVKEGENAVFNMQISYGYSYISSEGATYNYEDGTLTVSNVSKNVNIDFIVEPDVSDSDETFIYIFKAGSALDTTSVAPGMGIKAGTKIKLTAGDRSRMFLGWSLNYTIDGGGSILSTSPVFEFSLLSSYTSGGVLTVYANYASADTLYYHTGGGSINKSSPNLKLNPYYTASVGGDTVTVIYDEDYLDYFECGSSFYDDGTFYREGYVLIEYNTRPDGTGESYSPGAKVPLISGGIPTTLYCIWSADTSHSDFEYESIHIGRPASVPGDYAPHWTESGIIITRYKGDDECVTVPEKIDGKTVIAIAEGAFVNKSIKELVLSRFILEIKDGAFLGCDDLTTVHYPDGIYYISDDAFDEGTYTSFKNFYVRATLAPRFGGSDVGALAVKLSRLLASSDMDRIIVISGSSSLQGLGTEYLEALLGGEMRVINFGTTRTTHGALYLEAMGSLTHEGDLIVYAPENSAYMYGERELYYKTFRDLEGMINIYRYVDFSNYNGMFSSMSDLNRNYRYTKAPISYESICAHGELLYARPTYDTATTNKYGDFLSSKREYLSSSYHDTYFVTLNNRVKSRFEGEIYGDGQIANKDYTDENNITWASIDDEYFTEIMNMAIIRAKSSGARVYFGFCPVDASALVSGADKISWLMNYNKLIDDLYVFDGRVGSAYSYIYDHSYFYDSAFHPNDYGRVYRTYQLYRDLCVILGIKDVKDLRGVGEDFEGCLFEAGSFNYPNKIWTPKN